MQTQLYFSIQLITYENTVHVLYSVLLRPAAQVYSWFIYK